MTNFLDLQFFTKLSKHPLLMILFAILITDYLCCGGNMFKRNDKDKDKEDDQQ